MRCARLAGKSCSNGNEAEKGADEGPASGWQGLKGGRKGGRGEDLHFSGRRGNLKERALL